MSNLNSEIEEASVGAMLPITTPDETLSKATPASIDDAFNALKLNVDSDETEECGDDNFDESAADLGAIVKAFKARKKYRRNVGNHKEECKEFIQVIGKVEKYLKEKDKDFVPYGSLKREVRAVSNEEKEEILKSGGFDGSDKNIKLSVMKFMNGDKIYCRLTIAQHPDKGNDSIEVGMDPMDAPMKYWNYYTDSIDVKYLHVPPAFLKDWKKIADKFEKGKDVKLEYVGDELMENGIESVLYEHLKEWEKPDGVVFESFFGKKKKSNFTINPFEYSKDGYAKAIKEFYEDLIYGLDEFYAKDVIYSDGSIHINQNSDGPVPDELNNNINNPRLSKHKLYDFTWRYIFKYGKFTFSIKIDPDMFTLDIELLYVEGATDYYTLDEFLKFVGKNKKAFNFWDPGDIKCDANCISVKKHVNADGIFEKPTEVSKSKGVTTIKFIDDNFNESFNEEEFTEAAKIDDDIKDIIKTLNDKGYETKYSCSGHPSARLKSDGKRDGIKDKKLYSTARVVFAKSYDFPSIPEGWEEKTFDDGSTGIYVKGPTFKIINGLPTEQFYKWKQKYMNHLEKWAKDLPNVDDLGKKSEEMDESVNEIFQDLMIDLS